MVIRWKKYYHKLREKFDTVILLTAVILGALIIQDYFIGDFSYFKITVLSACLTFLLCRRISGGYEKLFHTMAQTGWSAFEQAMRRQYQLQHIAAPGIFGMACCLIVISDYINLFYFYYDVEYMLLLFGMLFLIVEACIYFSFHSPRWDYERDLYHLDCFCRELEVGKPEAENPFPEQTPFYLYGKLLSDTVKTAKGAVEKQVKSERLKVDLITNVSHDLKTPLTSMIGYLDLLKKETLDDTARDYVELIALKSEKLKEMIEDLFNLAKTSSGNADLKIERMDINKLAEQTLSDMEAVFIQSGKTLKLKLDKRELPFYSDSSHMYHVCQNLFENAAKFSLPGTRIYAETVDHDNQVSLMVTNTANYEMTFSEDSIVERFIRADEARSTDGNGLGLAIAKTYTEACGGDFYLKIDGDQFRAGFCFPKAELS